MSLPSFKLDSGACFSFSTFGSNVSFPRLCLSNDSSATLVLSLVTCLHDILSGGLYLTAPIFLCRLLAKSPQLQSLVLFFPSLHSHDISFFFYLHLRNGCLVTLKFIARPNRFFKVFAKSKISLGELRLQGINLIPNFEFIASIPRNRLSTPAVELKLQVRFQDLLTKRY